MGSSPESPRLAHKRRVRLTLNVMAVCLIATAALAVPFVLHAAHAASPSRATSSCAQLPASKDLTAMSPQQLQGYGISPALTKMPRWKSIAPHLRHRFCFPAHTSAPAVQHGIMQPQRADSTCPASCIAGLEGDNSMWPLSTMIGSWVVPCPVFSDASAMADTWVGVGGLEGNGPMVRAGIRQQINTFTINIPGGSETINDPIAYAYYQDTADPATANIQAGFAVNCGDRVDVGAYVAWPTEVSVFDEMTGDWFVQPINPNADETNAGCAVEDPNAGAQPLLDFGTLTFTDCQNQDGTGLLAEPASVQRNIAGLAHVANIGNEIPGWPPDGSTFSVIYGCSLDPDTCV